MSSGGVVLNFWDNVLAEWKAVSLANPLPISGTINATTAATATAANPAYAEGQAAPLSQTRFGALRTMLLTPAGVPYTAFAGATANAVAPTVADGSTGNPFSMNLKSAIRFIPTIPAGGDFDLSAPALLAGVDGITAASLANPLPVGVAQASSTAGQYGPLVQGAVTTGAPAYADGQTRPFSITTGGELRVTGGTVTQGSATAGQSGMLMLAAATTAAPAYTSGQTVALSLTLAGAVRVEPVSVVGAKSAGTAAASSQLAGTIFSNTWVGATVDGQQQALRSENTGQLQTSLYAGGAGLRSQTPTSGLPLPGANFLLTWSNLALFDGANWNENRNIGGSISNPQTVAAMDLAGRSKRNINTAATTQVKGAPGYLYDVVVNTPVASATISIYDATTGTTNPIAVITLPSTITSLAPFSLQYNVQCDTGIRVITSAAVDITVTYR